jgi:replicative DNA helicase
MVQVELLILTNLIYNDEYLRKVLPFIKKEYFDDFNQRVIFEEVSSFVIEYNNTPTKEILSIEIEKRSDINQEQFNSIINLIASHEPTVTEMQWLIDTTEKWCRDRAIYLALMESIHIADGKDEKKNRDSIPSILSDALAVSFDNHIGHDYFNDYEKRFEAYQKVEDKIPFDVEYLNKITKGGISKKTLSIFMASTGVGKSLTLCHIAASTLLQNKNVLYITLEMSENKIAERIDANLMNIDIKEFPTLAKSTFESKVNSLSKKTQGALIIKEYPTASAHSGHFKSLINELQLKKSFVPDLIIIDYMNICTSSRYKSNISVNSYNYVKAIAEELRGLAVEYNVPLITATQTNRGGMNNSDIDLTDTSESIGGPMTADLLLALISTEELEELNQIMIKQLKNRYADPTLYKRFVVGIDRAKMRLYDVDQKAQDDILDSGVNPEYDREETKFKEKFGGFKF